MIFFGFNKFKFFNIFTEYFIGIMLIYILVVFILLVSNIYGILIQKIVAEISCFILFLSCFFIYQEDLFFNWFFNNFSFIKFNYIGFGSFFLTNSLSNLSKVIVSFSCIFYLLIVANVLKNYKIMSFEYLILIMFANLGLLLLCCVNDFLTTFLIIELISLCSYLLAAFKKNSIYSLESGIKYLIVGAISSSFFLLGSCFIYSYTGSLNFSDLKFVMLDFKKFFSFYNFIIMQNNNTSIFYNFFFEIGIVFILISVFIKLALAPFHLWALDIYEGSPSTSTFFFSTITKLSFFIFLYKFYFLITFTKFSEFWFFFNVLIGFLSVLFGSLGGLRQRRVKTLLAYSSISHMGYAFLSFTTFTKFGLEFFYFYFTSYIFANIVIWYVILSLKQKILDTNKISKDLGDLVLLNKSNKFLAFGLSVAFFSLAGIPPLLGFIAKFGVFLVLIFEQLYTISLLVIFCSIISTFYYLRIIKILYFENLTVGKLYYFSSENIFIFSFFVFLLIFLFFKPTILYLFIHKMVIFENLIG